MLIDAIVFDGSDREELHLRSDCRRQVPRHDTGAGFGGTEVRLRHVRGNLFTESGICSRSGENRDAPTSSSLAHKYDSLRRTERTRGTLT